MKPTAQLAVVPAQLAFQGFRLPDGNLITAELTQPLDRFAVLIKPAEGMPQLHSIHDSEREAQRKCAEILEAWDGEWVEAPKGSLQ